MRISVVIPHYGDPETTMPLVRALLPQRPHQLIVSDDCSPVPFPQTEGVQVIRRERNGGFGSAVNTGAAAATGDWLLVLNSDLEVSPSFLTDLVEAATPWMPAVIGPRVLDPDGRPAFTARRFPAVSHQVIEWLTPLARFRDTRWWHRGVGHEPVRDAPMPTDWLVGAALLLPLDCFREVGGFDEGYFMNVEEVDLQRRLARLGVPRVWLPQPRVVHEGGGSSDPERQREWLMSSRLRYVGIWGGRRRLQAALTAAAAANLLWNTVRAGLGRQVAPIRTARQELGLIWRAGRTPGA
ncbi:MAG: glycosyltransferase family 2 protein [Propionibacteriaceae bacterium]|nr:glycosyltransferase family 2 protein [Propionibacteriaceae bacterium]